VNSTQGHLELFVRHLVALISAIQLMDSNQILDQNHGPYLDFYLLVDQEYHEHME
jgi:hypothetical protein